MTEQSVLWPDWTGRAMSPAGCYAVTYRYESGGGGFVTELQVNAAGFVIRCPDFWQVEVDD